MSKKDDLLKNSKVFCVLPWIHMHAVPSGDVYPCCYANMMHKMGNLRQSSMKEVWNNTSYQEIRKNMLNEIPTNSVCNKCYEQEQVGIYSLRQNMNKSLALTDDIMELIQQTTEHGYLNQFKLKYWDVRFSNLCNFSCRTCAPAFSSKWYKDYIDMYKTKPKNFDGSDLNVIEYAGKDKTDILNQMEEHLPYIEQIYFAGGEPLIMEEHYLILEKLIELGRTNINIQYNTNFSELSYKKKHVFDLWKHFEHVSVGASLDASGQRAEYMRKGTDWKQVIANREHMIKEVPHVDFYISATLSVMNSFHIVDFHREWVDLGFIRPKDFDVNVLYGPLWYRLNLLPKEEKYNKLIPLYERHLEWLYKTDEYRRATVGFEGAIKFLKFEDLSHLIDSFNVKIKEIDKVRNEDLWEVFPELECLRQ